LMKLIDIFLFKFGKFLVTTRG